MQRTVINYDGAEYIVAGDAADVRAQVDAILKTGNPGWLRVNHGRGELRPADLLVSAAIAISLVDANDPPDASD
jgi:hypothetical protein